MYLTKKVSQENMIHRLREGSYKNTRVNKCVHNIIVRYSPSFIRICDIVRDKVKMGRMHF